VHVFSKTVVVLSLGVLSLTFSPFGHDVGNTAVLQRRPLRLSQIADSSVATSVAGAVSPVSTLPSESAARLLSATKTVALRRRRALAPRAKTGEEDTYILHQGDLCSVAMYPMIRIPIGGTTLAR
jgi:hypothetical protein